jgi:carboxypeptidase family protein
MEGPKHRWFTALGALLAVGVLLLLARPWVSTTNEPVPAATTTTPAQQVVESRPVEATVSSPAATASSSPTGGGFRGRVIDAVTRRPVTEFEIRLTRVQRGQMRTQEDPITRTFQSETGRFAWDDVPPDTWQVVVATHGYQQFNAGELSIVAGKTTREIVMRLLRGYAVRGRVFEKSTGAGIVDAWVSFREATEWRGAGRDGPYTKSKEDGSFVLEGVPGGDIVLTVGAQEHAYRMVEIVVGEKTPPQEIALSSGGTIAGTVTTTTGAPVKGEILLSGPDIGYFDKTDEAGRFAFKHMRAANYSLRANTVAGSASQDIVLGPDERKEDIVLVVGGGRSVRGALRGLRPEQFSQAFVSLRPKSGSAYFSTRVDEQGGYVMNGVPPGGAQLSVHAGTPNGGDRQLNKSVNVPADRDIVVDIVFPPGARLSGRVTQGGKAAPDKNVWMGPAESESGTLYRARTSEDGRYEIEGLPPGDYRIRADEDVGRSITIAGDAVLNIDIPLVQLAGRVVEYGGDVPIVAADVYIRGSETATARVRAYKATDHFGHFNLTGIEPGEILLTVYKTGYELYREKIAYASPITNKAIALRNDSGVEVRVHRSSKSGEPVRGFMVSEKIPGIDREIDLWIPLDREGVGFLPRALAGSTLQIYGRDEPIVIREWDGSSLDLTF